MNKENFHIYSDQVFIDNELQAASISISAGKITAIDIGNKIEGAKDYSGLVIMPGAIDAHVHINEPGRTDWEGFETATKAAVRGGITTLVDMPLNSSPVVTNRLAFIDKLIACENKLYANCGFWAGATDDSKDKIQALIEAGCLGVKVFLSHSGIDEFPNISLSDLDKLMGGIKALEIPILAHCELDTLPAEDLLSENPKVYDAYLKTRPKLWENEAIKKFIALSEKHQCKVHIVHLASDEMVDWIDSRKKMGIPFTVETCPHYILFAAEEIQDGNTLYKCSPPIRKSSNAQNLKQAIKNGVIDFIASDHSPAPPDIKEIESGNFKKAWGGIAGLQFLLSASWTALKEEISLTEFIPLLTSKPASFLNLQNHKGALKEGYDADITIWNPSASFQVEENIIEHKHKATPYLKQTLFGQIHTTIVNGQFALENETINSTPFGNTVLRKQHI